MSDKGERGSDEVSRRPHEVVGTRLLGDGRGGGTAVATAGTQSRGRFSTRPPATIAFVPVRAHNGGDGGRAVIN